MSDWKELEQRVADDYRKRGYRVLQHPIEEGDVPAQADLVALGPDESVIIEFKRWSDLGSTDVVRQLADWVIRHPGWRLELVVPSERLPVRLPTMSLDETTHRMELADLLARTGDYKAAAILLWSAAEAMTRHISRPEDATAQIIAPDDVVNLLVSEGYVDKAAEPAIQSLAFAANLNLHGAGIALPEFAYGTARRVLENLVSSLKQTKPPQEGH